MLLEGLSLGEIARALGLSKPTVCHHARALGFEGDERFRRRLQLLCPNCHALTESFGVRNRAA